MQIKSEEVLISFKLGQNEISHSGVLIDNWILTTAAPLISCIDAHERAKLLKFVDRNFYKHNKTSLINSDISIRTRGTILKKRCPMKGTINYLWNSESMRNALSVLFEEWKFNLFENCDSKESALQIASCFMIIKFKGTPDVDLLEMAKSLELLGNRSSRMYQGEKLTVVSSPFGMVEFFNSWSEGVVSNILDDKQILILMDVRLAPACEGAPVYRKGLGQMNQLIAIVISPLYMDTGELLGFSLCASIKEIAKSIFSLTNYKVHNRRLNLYGETAHNCLEDDNNHLQHFHKADIFKKVVVVNCMNRWSSGVMFGTGFILTCSHTINFGNVGHKDIKIIIEGRTIKGELLYATPLESVYDIALIYFEPNGVDFEGIHIATIPPKLGDRVFAVGHSLFSHGFPSVSSGIVSKIDSHLFTTCVVHSGMSGGAILDKDGFIVGVIGYNVKAGYLFPSVNLSAPTTVFGTALQKFVSERDVSILQQWNQKESRGSELYQSKL